MPGKMAIDFSSTRQKVKIGRRPPSCLNFSPSLSDVSIKNRTLTLFKLRATSHKVKVKAMKKIIWLPLLFCLNLTSLSAYALSYKEYSHKPKLVVVIVIDQFRADMLSRPLLNHRVEEGGFEYLMNRGAYFPFAQYLALQDMTCPGHATILTGANPASHGINLNDWYDSSQNKDVYCVQDDKDGVSPRRLRSTTVGDELKAASKKSRVYSLSLKDRAAIMLGGHNPDLAVWMNSKTKQWETSNYYLKNSLPSWIQTQNKKITSASPDLESETVQGATNATQVTLDLALGAIESEKLGKSSSTDLLAISLSSHDILGHRFGPDSAETQFFTRAENKLLKDFLTRLQKQLGSMKDVVVVLTADHGTPPTVEVAQAAHLESDRIDAKDLLEKLNSLLTKELGAADPHGWILATRSFNFYLNQELLKKKEISSTRVQKIIQDFLVKQKGVDQVFTRSQFEEQHFPQGLLGQQVRNSYIPEQSGDVILIPLPFYYVTSDVPVTHMTGWSYDRSVPLILMGADFKPGVYSGANIIDLAPTLSFLLGVLPPAMSEGRVLSEVIR
jgi:predicted AlkP superfamily pyrophosphatase or phosphodiesterase